MFIGSRNFLPEMSCKIPVWFGVGKISVVAKTMFEHRRVNSLQSRVRDGWVERGSPRRVGVLSPDTLFGNCRLPRGFVSWSYGCHLKLPSKFCFNLSSPQPKVTDNEPVHRKYLQLSTPSPLQLSPLPQLLFKVPIFCIVQFLLLVWHSGHTGSCKSIVQRRDGPEG